MQNHKKPILSSRNTTSDQQLNTVTERHTWSQYGGRGRSSRPGPDNYEETRNSCCSIRYVTISIYYYYRFTLLFYIVVHNFLAFWYFFSTHFVLRTYFHMYDFFPNGGVKNMNVSLRLVTNISLGRCATKTTSTWHRFYSVFTSPNLATLRNSREFLTMDDLWD